MTGNFFESETKENLMRAFAGESQARNRYTIAAEKAREKGMYTIADVRFYELLKEFTGSTIQIDGTYPVDQQDTLEELLRAAEHNEKEEFEDVYPAFGSTAKAEGFLEAASTFFQIAEIEHTHQERLENGTYYSREEQGRWICTNCGYIHDGKQAPSVCPVCRHEKGYFLPYEYAPYKGAGK